MAEEQVFHLMEVCGTHTMSIAKAGIRSLLPPHIRLVSGPGCPVCVTPPEVIDMALRLTERPEVTVTTYGDMIRVPGSRRGDNLRRRSAEGADVRIVYSPVDAVELAKSLPERQVVFLGVGFETSAPGTASAVELAAEAGLANFTVLSMLKQTEPAIRALASDPEFNIQGFLCPGHVAAIIGEEGLRFIAEDLHIPAVIAGFEPTQILQAIRLLLLQLRAGEARLENAYTEVVRPEGNPLAIAQIRRVFEPCDSLWRGLGEIPASGWQLREEYAAFDAQRRFGLKQEPAVQKSACRCGEVIRGKLSPEKCPLFGTVCVPEDPEGPCMVSSEGACAAAYKYRGVI